MLYFYLFKLDNKILNKLHLIKYNNSNFYFIKNDFEKIEQDYFLILEIPCINLNQLIYDINSEQNDVNSHVEILKNSNIYKNLYFFAGHSGNGKVSYFNEIENLRVGDMIFVYLVDKKLSFIVNEIYLIPKKGYLIVDNDAYNTLFLITCSLAFDNKQLVVQANLM